MFTTKDNPGMAPKIQYHLFKNKYGTFPTQGSDKGRILLGDIIKKYNKKTFVEIGVYGGASLFYLKDKFPELIIYGIDPHDKIEIFNGKTLDELNKKDVEERTNNLAKFRKNIEESIEKYNLDIKYINNTSWNVYKEFKDNSIDVLFIDGDHSYNGVKKDLELFYPKMSKDGIIIMDDYNWTPIKKASTEFVQKHGLTHIVPSELRGTKLIIYMDSKSVL